MYLKPPSNESYGTVEIESRFVPCRRSNKLICNSINEMREVVKEIFRWVQSVPRTVVNRPSEK